ncbi:MAG: thiosulfate sulfurtransferase [Rhodospirillaceae bacterium]|jgi:rhodanese-related sulfurtransferase|nr:thiosulfate sulfurtransferase [Rhodospirillaceae bacterium]MBT4687403.1 thiosulfate sulfurtransferase [Rhodospirillaceae bacterium]MBT5079697.1 thiosulfate sulfurtransferase [Rhodospirillaceae bacterium]MBT5527195.1 thiosulfate sulfurtransferase [Rhodospirillaceae bacterium]MBT5882091.1 thiosulfate sulfurtransferase [Rhodospirillaceae bacterium]
MTNYVSANDLKAMLSDGDELALLDVREEGAHSQSHLFYTVPMPLSVLELLAQSLVPRFSTRMVLVDAGGGFAERAAAKLSAMGYSDVSCLQDGTAGWEAAGYVLFSGVHVPCKAFGEYVEHHYGTPHIAATELQAMREAGEDVVILDSRPMDEYQVMNIPDGIDCPGAELACRVHDLAPNPDTLVVVNCAGRTRSIIGAQSLINAAIPNKVMALENGTMGWHLAGYELERGNSRAAPPPSTAGQLKAQASAVAAGTKFEVPRIDRATLAQWQAEAEERTLYVLDVRDPLEYAAGHPVGVANAPGGQLVQGVDEWCGTLGARVVLVDDTGVRATMTASWLVQMGWDVAVLEGGLDGFEMTTVVPRPGPEGIGRVAENEISPADLAARVAAGDVLVVDLAPSRDYDQGHIPGAWWAVRARLPQSLPKLGEASLLVLTSPDAIVARLAAPEVSELTGMEIAVLAGGTAAWQAEGHDMAQGLEHLADERDDTWLKPYDHPEGVEDRMRAYLTWEIDLLGEIERDGDHRFRLFL